MSLDFDQSSFSATFPCCSFAPEALERASDASVNHHLGPQSNALNCFFTRSFMSPVSQWSKAKAGSVKQDDTHLRSQADQ